MERPEESIELTKQVVNQLNSLLDKKLNVISYDNLKEEQRIELLLQILREIDPRVRVLPSFRPLLPLPHILSLSCHPCFLTSFLRLSSSQINVSSFESADPEEVVVKILDMLRVLKYQPPTEIGSYDVASSSRIASLMATFVFFSCLSVCLPCFSYPGLGFTKRSSPATRKS